MNSLEWTVPLIATQGFFWLETSLNIVMSWIILELSLGYSYAQPTDDDEDNNRLML